MMVRALRLAAAALVAASAAASGELHLIKELTFDSSNHLRLSGQSDSGLPLVFAHGMGDACDNPGMAQIVKVAGEHLKVYSTCIADGDSQPADTLNGFLLNMDNIVKDFAKRVRADPKLAGGFDAAGLSQGNLVIRGYVERYNNPPVRRFLSIHGPLAGTGSLPRCNPDGFASFLCRSVSDMVGKLAYTEQIQEHVAQANFLKDPTELAAYRKTCKFLPQLNNEVEHPDSATFKKNFASLDKLVLVKALQDTMIFPSESEWFGFFKDGDYGVVLPYNETEAYTSDAFGLRTLVNAGKVFFESTPQDHLQFTLSELFRWLDKYFR